MSLTECLIEKGRGPVFLTLLTVNGEVNGSKIVVIDFAAGLTNRSVYHSFSLKETPLIVTYSHSGYA